MGPLAGLKVIEIAGIGPGPFCGMMLADMGADVVRVDRAQNVVGGDPALPPNDLLARGRRSIGVDLKNPEGVNVVLDLAAGADVLIEGFRPGVAERLGIGPDDCHARNPRLVYGRMTGWGQGGPWGPMAGHDINYIALAGALEPIGRAGEPPLPPINLVGDFGGGGMLLAFGVLAGVFEAQRSGKGQVIDAAMVDGAAALMTMTHSFRAMGMWTDERGTNMLDTGAHFYEVYETSDGKYMSVGSIEAQFYAALLEGLGVDPRRPALPARPEPVAGAQGALRRDLQDQDPRRVDRRLRGHRRLRRPGADDPRGRGAPPQRRAGHVRRGGGHPAARPGAALRPHVAGDLGPAAPRRPAHRRDPRRVRRRCRPHRQAPRASAPSPSARPAPQTQTTHRKQDARPGLTLRAAVACGIRASDRCRRRWGPGAGSGGAARCRRDATRRWGPARARSGRGRRRTG
jgi:crotonobetainyl-CoA:carnitine CoA-transferase CaiB-like acyl-CoA transferase